MSLHCTTYRLGPHSIITAPSSQGKSRSFTRKDLLSGYSVRSACPRRCRCSREQPRVAAFGECVVLDRDGWPTDACSLAQARSQPEKGRFWETKDLRASQSSDDRKPDLCLVGSM